MKRAGIFCMFGKTNVPVADYVIYLLQQAATVINEIIVVCNGAITTTDKEKLSPYAAKIVVRENIGYDAGAWREIILNDPRLTTVFDELVLFNDSFYGPLYPFSDIFAKMTAFDADFWGITVHGQAPDPTGISPFGYIPEHLQTYFLVIRANLLKSASFLAYWQETANAATFDEAVFRYEVCFTRHFTELGFSFAVYCDTRAYEQPADLKTNLYLYAQLRLLKDFRCPVLKKKALQTPRRNLLEQNYGTEPRESLRFIEKNTAYDTALIYRHLLSATNTAALKECLGLNYVLSADFAPTHDFLGKVAVVVHLYYKDLADECLNYICRLPSFIAVFVTVNSEDMRQYLTKAFAERGRQPQIRLAASRGRELGAFLQNCADIVAEYEFLCFIHDKKSLRTAQSIVVGDAFFHLLWDNTLGNGEAFVRNVLDTFSKEPLLGLLVPPSPYHSDYGLLNGYYWSDDCYDQTIALAKMLSIDTGHIELAFTPLALGSVFWCRTKILRKIFAKKWRPEDFPDEPMPVDGTINHALERIFPFAAQDAGFYTGCLMESSFAANHMENVKYLSVNEPYRTVLLKKTLKAYVPARYWPVLRRIKNIYDKIFR